MRVKGDSGDVFSSSLVFIVRLRWLFCELLSGIWRWWNSLVSFAVLLFWAALLGTIPAATAVTSGGGGSFFAVAVVA